MISTQKYKLAKFSASLIKPYLPDNHMLYSTKDFLENLYQFKCKADYKVITFDVQTLFMNVPLDETIQITADFMYSDDNCSKHKSLTIKKIFCETSTVG